MDSAFALNGFEKDGADGIVKFHLEIRDVVEADKFDARDQWREGQAVLFRRGDADGAESAPMKRILQGQKAMLLRCRAWGLVRLAPKESRKFHRAVNGFGATIRKKDAVHPGPAGEFAREWALIGMVKEIRKMNGARSFAADPFHDARMRVPERVHGDTAQKIEILFSGGIENAGAAAVSHERGLALGGGQKELLGIEQARVGFGDFRRRLFGLRHGARRGFLFGRSAHHATERAARAADSGSRRTRVPGIDGTPSVPDDSAACDASNKASYAAPPTIRTSPTPPSMARLAASSLRIMPPEMTRH